MPGLSENRPSVLRGDWLYVRSRATDGKLGTKEFQGFVHEVMLNEVALGFDERWVYSPNYKVVRPILRNSIFVLHLIENHLKGAC